MVANAGSMLKIKSSELHALQLVLLNKSKPFHPVMGAPFSHVISDGAQMPSMPFARAASGSAPVQFSGCGVEVTFTLHLRGTLSQQYTFCVSPGLASTHCRAPGRVGLAPEASSHLPCDPTIPLAT